METVTGSHARQCVVNWLVFQWQSLALRRQGALFGEHHNPDAWLRANVQFLDEQKCALWFRQTAVQYEELAELLATMFLFLADASTTVTLKPCFDMALRRVRSAPEPRAPPAPSRPVIEEVSAAGPYAGPSRAHGNVQRFASTMLAIMPPDVTGAEPAPRDDDFVVYDEQRPVSHADSARPRAPKRPRDEGSCESGARGEEPPADEPTAEELSAALRLLQRCRKGKLPL
jgi:hypothetical protein